jgi:hypothetical protein
MLLCNVSGTLAQEVRLLRGHATFGCDCLGNIKPLRQELGPVHLAIQCIMLIRQIHRFPKLVLPMSHPRCFFEGCPPPPPPPRYADLERCTLGVLYKAHTRHVQVQDMHWIYKCIHQSKAGGTAPAISLGNCRSIRRFGNASGWPHLAISFRHERFAPGPTMLIFFEQMPV